MNTYITYRRGNLEVTKHIFFPYNFTGVAIAKLWNISNEKYSYSLFKRKIFKNNNIE